MSKAVKRVASSVSTIAKKEKIVEKYVDRVMALSMRPKSLDSLVGQETLVKTLESQFKSKRIPHFFLLSGPVGSGKTTIARILSLLIQKNPSVSQSLTSEDWNNYKKYDITEINAANKTGVDDMRALIQTMKYRPISPSTAKIVILDEAHQLSNAAQNVLITETEDVANYIFFIFCTSQVSKIIHALKRRAFIISPSVLDKKSTRILVENAAKKSNFSGKIEEFLESLETYQISSPGIVLQACERFFCGFSATESCVLEQVSEFDVMKICRLVSSANWSGAAEVLKDAKKSDVYMLKSCLLGYLRAILLKTSGSKAVNLAKAAKVIAESNMEDSAILVSFLASICLACEYIKLNK